MPESDDHSFTEFESVKLADVVQLFSVLYGVGSWVCGSFSIYS